MKQKTTNKTLEPISYDEYERLIKSNTEKQKKPNNTPWGLTLVISIVFLGLFALLITLIISGNLPQKFGGTCEVSGIVYTDVAVKNATCMDPFSAHYCPLPTNVKCSFNGEFNPSLIVNAILNSY